jgi:hypothetical protein
MLGKLAGKPSTPSTSEAVSQDELARVTDLNSFSINGPEIRCVKGDVEVGSGFPCPVEVCKLGVCRTGENAN